MPCSGPIAEARREQVLAGSARRRSGPGGDDGDEEESEETDDEVPQPESPRAANESCADRHQ